MPRLPVDGKKVVEHRITLGTKERDLLESAVFSYRVQAITGDHPITEILADPIKIIAFVEALATLLELFGIETPIPTPVDAYQWLDGVKRHEAGRWEREYKPNILEFLEKIGLS